MPEIRCYRPSDRDDVYEVCVRTGDSGADARGRYGTDDLLPDIYALPYVDLEPQWAHVVDSGTRVSGYLVAAPDTRAFVERYRSHWLPDFAAKYATGRHPAAHARSGFIDAEGQAHFVDTGLHPERMLIAELDEYPAHLHIDLLPELQGQGFGRALIRTLVQRLREAGVPGVHLGVGPTNTDARAFYARLGFIPLPSVADGTLLGLRADAEL